MRKNPVFIGMACILFCSSAKASTNVKNDPEFDEILSLDISQLTVTSVSKKEERLSDAAAAIYVITNEDIKRMGVTSIPEALRIVPGLQVAQLSSNRWAVSSRGFNNAVSNKLLVLIDGRSIYTPVYSGVYWDMNDVLMEDIDRIEVIRGPGASLWGANAVDGVINIITKKTSETKGTYLSQSFGTEEYSTTEGRVGKQLDDETSYRVYAKDFHRGKTTMQGGGDNQDDWYRLRSGFRMDTQKQNGDSLTLEGDVYGGEQSLFSRSPTTTPPFSTTSLTDDNASGGNILGRWNHKTSDTSANSLQVYIDHYNREEVIARQHITTADIDYQNNMALDDRNNFIWGLGYRYIAEDLGSSFQTSFFDNNRSYNILSAFLQNEYAVVRNKVFLTLGSKFEHNDFTGFEIQPTARLSWKVDNKQTLWGAVSRAVRIPSMVEDDINLLALVSPGTTPTSPLNEIRLFSNNKLNAEELWAYELGYRIEPVKKVSLDNAVFFNHYENLVNFASLGPSFPNGGSVVIPFTYVNGGHGNVYGFETAATWHVTNYWQLSGSYQIIKLNLNADTGTTQITDNQESTPNNQFSVRSYLDLPHNLQFDNTLYYVDNIKFSNGTKIPRYFRLDTRLGWKVARNVDMSVVGRNLLEKEHTEFPSTPMAEIDRSLIAQISYKF